MSFTIWHKQHAIRQARIDKMREAMKEYDKEIYYPALKALREGCGASEKGHDKNVYNDNGIGYETWSCSKCGAVVEGQSYLNQENEENESTKPN